jgi:outer membrane protein assembly factor BamB
MSITARACAVVLSSLGLLALLSPLPVASADPQQKAAEAKKTQKRAAAKEEKKADDKKTDDKKAEDKKTDDKKVEATTDKPAAEAAPAAAGGAVAAPAVQAATPAAPAAPGAPGAKPAPATNPEDDLTDAITLPTDRKIKKRLELADVDYIEKKAWGEAARLLQSVLDLKEDVSVQVEREGANKRKKKAWVSARVEANRLIGKMPAEGLQFYELQFGPQARKALNDAKKSSDPQQQLAEVVLRYYHTDAGVEAADLLGTYSLDRGKPLEAALRYSQLLKREGADRLGAFTLFKAALAFRLAGAAYTEAAKDTWKRLAELVGRDGLQVGDETVALEQLQQELDRATVSESGLAFGWPLFRGNLSRSGKVNQASAPFLVSRWQRAKLDPSTWPGELSTQWKLGDETKYKILEALRLQQNHPEVMIPGFLPIASGGKAIFRSYWGVHAIDIKTGELAWHSQTTASLDALLDANRKNDTIQWLQNYKQGGNQNLIFENTVIGTLSTDNVRVYLVDDMGLPPHPSAVMGNPWGGFGGGGTSLGAHVAELAQRSLLVAIDLETGKLLWSHGDAQHGTEPELTGCYFLGPPLPLAGKLFVLTEKNAELRLVCLEPADGKLVWKQTLATAKEKLLQDVGRRVEAVNLSYADGILVCPTNAGAVLGIDLLSRSLVWAFPYREKSKENLTEQEKMQRRQRMWMGDPNGNLPKLSGQWKLSAPVIVDGKVVFTAPDGNAVHCLNLQDGDSIWQADRKDDLYLAGVYNGRVVLVGKNGCRALSLADGKKQLWTAETGTPSGMGVASGAFYYLPLKKGEVAKIDMEHGTVVAHSIAPKNIRGEVDSPPGNLLFYDGDVISQTETTVACYPQVDAEVAQINTLLTKNPKDPVALTKRGELRLYKGDLPGAVEDLHEAVRNNPPPDLLDKSRNKLYTTLTELLKQDFNSGERYLEEYKNLCKMTVPPSASAEQKQKLEEEQRSRQAGYLALVARGRENQGRLLDAFQAYLDFGALAEAKELVSVPTEPAVKARPDVWAQGRIAALVARASEAERKPLEDEIARRWQAVQKSNDREALARFVSAFGSLFGAGREARLQFAERLMQENAFLDAELQLLQLRGQQDDPQIGARAVEALARLMTRKHLMEDAAYYYRILAHDFAKVVVRDGKTGADLFEELATDKRFLPYLDEQASSLWSGSLTEKDVVVIPRGVPLPRTHLPYEAKSELVPFFQRYQFVWSLQQGAGMNAFQLQLLDRDNGEVRWTVTSAATKASYFSYNYMTGNWNPATVRFPFFARGHLVILYLGHTIVALDLVERRKLWERDLLNPDRVTFDQPYMQYQLSFDREGAMHLHNPQGGTHKLGQLGPVTASYVCIRDDDGLTAVDPVRGTTLWTKVDLTKDTQVFGDDEYVYLIDVKADNRVSSARALRGRDGASMEVPDFGAAFLRRKAILGSRILVSETDPNGGLVLRLYDIPSGTDLWKKNLPPNAVLLRSTEPELTSVIEPDGKMTVVNLNTQREIFQAYIRPGHLDKVTSGLLLRDRQYYYALLNRPAESNANMQGPWANVYSLQTELANGILYSFERATGKLAWYNSVPNQMILLEQFQELPMILFTARYNKRINDVGGLMPTTSTLSIDKITGKLIIEEHVIPSSPIPPSQYYALEIDRQAGTIDLVSTNKTLRHYVRAKRQAAGLGRQSGRVAPFGLPSVEGSSTSVKPRDAVVPAREN